MGIENKDRQGGNFAIDTMFVLFFLALELGRSAGGFGIDALLMSVTMLMVLILPYFLPSEDPSWSFSGWLAVRGGVAVGGLFLGAVWPASLQFLPMTLLIIAAMVSCYVQFYSLFKLRLAK